MQSTNINNSPSFGGVTRYLEREIYDLTKVQRRLLSFSTSEFVGQLPPKMLQDVIRISKTQQKKRENIFSIMGEFSNFARIVNVPRCWDCSPPSGWEKFCAKFKPKNELYKKLRFSHTKAQIEELINFLNNASKQMTKVFKEVGLLRGFEKIKIEYLGKGCSGSAFKLNFPKRTGYKSKILKVFEKSEFDGKQSKSNIFNHATSFHEINSMIFVKNAHKDRGFENSEYVEGYLASLKNPFMLLEDAYNYKFQEINEHNKIDHDLGLMLWDKSTDGNVLNGRMVDYGYIMQLDKMRYFLKKNPGIRK